MVNRRGGLAVSVLRENGGFSRKVRGEQHLSPRGRKETALSHGHAASPEGTRAVLGARERILQSCSPMTEKTAVSKKRSA